MMGKALTKKKKLSSIERASLYMKKAILFIPYYGFVIANKLYNCIVY
jgi:hypothetical protein